MNRKLIKNIGFLIVLLPMAAMMGAVNFHFFNYWQRYDFLFLVLLVELDIGFILCVVLAAKWVGK